MHSGIDFEDEGLRLRLHLGPKTPLPALPQPEVGAVLGKGEELIAYKVGRVLSYEGMAEYGPHSWKQEVLSKEKTPEGIVVSTSEPWSDDEDEGKWAGKYLIAKSGVWRMGGKDEFNTSTYTRMPLELPAELRLNQTHHNQVIGQDIYEENGEKEIEGNIERESIRVLGTETIVVKAGKFENCVVVERRTESLWGEYYELNERKEWYHPGTGLIKTVDDKGLGSDLIKIEQK